MKTLRFWVASMMLGTTLLGLAVVAHAKTDDQAAIKKLLNDLGAAFAAKDIDRIMHTLGARGAIGPPSDESNASK